MNAKLLHFILITVLLSFIGCSSVKVSDYVSPNYSDSEIRAIEIQNISENLKEKPVESLWKAYLLKNTENISGTSQSSDEIQLFNTSANYCLDLYYQAREKNDIVNANRYYSSLSLLAPDSVKEITIDFSEDQKKLASLATSHDARNEENDIIQTKKVSDFIAGTVTIWIDLGIKVEKGVGYANRVIGSGFFIRKDGYIVTNYHVIEETVNPKYEGYSRLYIKLSSDTETRIPARVVGYDKSLDIALLKTEVDAPYVFTLGSSLNLEVGDTIYAIGSPIGLTSTITRGIVSSYDRQLLSTAAVMQIDAAVNSGNSGGPLINKDGEVQGIVFAGITDYEGLNFAIPVEYLKAIIPRLYNDDFFDTNDTQNNSISLPKEVTSAWIGAYGITYKEPGQLEGSGVQVLYTMPGGSCDLAGIKSGDIITAINGQKVNSIEELGFEMVKLSSKMVVPFSLADSNRKDIPVYLDVRPEYPTLQIRERDSDYNLMYSLLGMKLENASASKKNQFIVTSIVKGSIADESGFSVHDSVTLEKMEAKEDDGYFVIQIYTKKRKSGYLNVSLSIGAPMDSYQIF
ncbi:MAG: hypothetical protein BKP49_06750 [Treponema sp. CETP13]|nr:MAG: hypothetical protein BKP49_06750 [Treponema sp. CETP13]